MLRVLLALLLLANALFFFWARGWLGSAWPPPGQSQREPERLTAQVKPDRLVLLGPEAARAATSAARSPALAPPSAINPASNPASAPPVVAAEAPAAQCLEAGPYTAAQLAAATKNLARLGVEANAWTQTPVAAPVWLVFAGRFADNAARRTRAQAWQRQGVPVPDNLDAPRELAPGLVFSRHISRADADAALATLALRHPPVASVARVVQASSAGAGLSMLRLAAVDAALAQRLREASLAPQDRFARCAAA